MFSYHADRYQYKQITFGSVPAGNMFQRKTDEISKELLNFFVIANDILVEEYDINN